MFRGITEMVDGLFFPVPTVCKTQGFKPETGDTEKRIGTSSKVGSKRNRNAASGWTFLYKIYQYYLEYDPRGNSSLKLFQLS